VNALALDAATEILSVALLTADGLIYAEIDGGLKHSERLLEMVDATLKTAGLPAKELTFVACMAGPGSFTGLRIGFAAAKGFSVGLGIPLLAMPTLDCMAAAHAAWPGTVVPCIDAKKNCFFTALYRRAQLAGAYLDADLITLGALLPRDEPSLLTGIDAPRAYAGLAADHDVRLDPYPRRGHARELLSLAMRRYETDAVGDADSAGPLYIRRSDAELVREAMHGQP
jgi:tRNA threonylcarbamoyladenosine biosynthesis protein TsaB